jgi:hypothetical protein
VLRRDKGKILFCACLELLGRGDSIKKVKEEYFHADDQQAAERIIKIAYPNRNRVRIVAVAPAIGTFAETEKNAERGEGTFRV